MTSDEYTAIGLHVRDSASSVTKIFRDPGTQLPRRGYYDADHNIFVSVHVETPDRIHTIFKPPAGRSYWDSLH